ncbi:hypothetical protein L6452_08411 [Arctium lappa]|uniref:Uncharacterized protein n=1 Tax=Arctium lappa TaxID=4217 RepID=A0ACB9DHP4_ARCLA|nr:hypothetical protein L6452_08411 [Arctium lappa]
MSKCHEYSQNARKGVLELFSSFKVLVVGHNTNFLISVACLLHSSSFEVTYVDHPGAALALLSEKENEFDLLLIESDTTGMDIHTFLRLAKNMDLLSVVMAENRDDTLVLEALKSGAFLVLKKPLTTDVVMHLRQYAIKERVNKNYKYHNESMIHKAATQQESIEDNRSFGSKRKDRDEPMKHVVGSHLDNNMVYQSAVDAAAEDSIKKKICIEWTQELHEKFLNAISQLGDGRCYPKEIHKLMGVPGLTRIQIASHLQMYRLGRRKSNEMQTETSSSRNHALSSNHSPQEVGERKSGRVPSSQIDPNDEGDRNLIDLKLSLS